MKVVVVNRFFYPDVAATGQFAADLAFDLAEAGHEVHVVTSRLAYDGGPGYPAEETVHGVRVNRVWTSRYGRGSLPGRMLDYASFYVSSTWRLLRLLRTGDIVIAMTDPPLLSVCAAWAARWRGARLVNWVQDLFPEVAAALGFPALGGILGVPLRAMRDRSLRFAVMNVALGERMAAWLRQRGGEGCKVRVIHNWADGALIRPTELHENRLRSEWALADRFVVGYSGNMGRAHDI
ncbi:MAG: glycosyltransferase family 4 protein, partial [Dehalococcoidia bacterium]